MPALLSCLFAALLVWTFQINIWDLLHVTQQLVSCKAQPVLTSARRQVQGLNQKEESNVHTVTSGNVGHARD